MSTRPHPLAPKMNPTGSPFEFEFMSIEDLNNDFYKNYMDEQARKKLIRAALERKIKALNINACDSKQRA